MRRTGLAILALLVLGTAPAGAVPSRPATQTWVLQYGRTPGANAPARLIGRLHALGLHARAFQRLPMLLVRGPAARVRAAAHAPGVLYGHRVGRRVRFELDRSVPLVFHRAQQATWSAGGDGRGTTVAVMDTGIDGTHQDLIDQVSANVEFAFDSQAVDDGAAAGVLPPVVVAQECPGPCNTDAFGHGTHVAGIIAGTGGLSSGKETGVAPGAKLVGLSISDSGTAYDWYALAGFDYILAHPELGITAVNNSWGLNNPVFDPTAPMEQATKMVHDKGITVIFSAGNSGAGTPRGHQPEGSSDCTGDGSGCAINTNSVAPWVVSVAAGSRILPEGGLESQHIADFSSRGDPEAHVVNGVETLFQPDITAPGTAIMSTDNYASAIGNPAACAGVGDAPRCTVDRDPATAPFYTALSGTSMAAPHITAAVAVLQGAAKGKLGRALTPDEARGLLVAGAQQLAGIDAHYDDCGTDLPTYDGPCGEVTDGHTGKPYAPWQVGAGYLDVIASLRALDELAAPKPAPAVAPAVAPKATPKAAPRKKAKKKAKHKKKHARRSHHKPARHGR